MHKTLKIGTDGKEWAWERVIRVKDGDALLDNRYIDDRAHPNYAQNTKFEDDGTVTQFGKMIASWEYVRGRHRPLED